MRYSTIKEFILVMLSNVWKLLAAISDRLSTSQLAAIADLSNLSTLSNLHKYTVMLPSSCRIRGGNAAKVASGMLQPSIEHFSGAHGAFIR